MCELFAMSSLFATTVNFSLEEFARHGGHTGPHRDGWGIAYYDDREVRLVKEAEAAADSDWVRFIKKHRLHSSLVVSHIRRATHGEPALKNTQPFCRELGGRMHVFAHNGELPGIEVAPAFSLGRFRPVGTTDSEHAFCVLLERLTTLWLSNTDMPPLEARLEIVVRFAEDLREHGIANFLYADGDGIFAHGHHRRPRGGGPLAPPGLVTLCRHCEGNVAETRAAGLSIPARQDVALVASVPLTAEAWRPLAEGEVAVLVQGRVLSNNSDIRRH